MFFLVMDRDRVYLWDGWTFYKQRLAAFNAAVMSVGALCPSQEVVHVCKKKTN